MKYFIIVFCFFAFIQEISAAKLLNYKIHIVTWDGSRVTGRVFGITDSLISIRINKGQIYSFNAHQVKNLKIWRPYINLPFSLVGTAGLPILLTRGNSGDGFNGAVMLVLGIPLGAIGGLLIGDTLSTKVNIRRAHISDLKSINSRLTNES